MRKIPWKAVFISIVTYLVFFYPMLSSLLMYSGSDTANLHYPKRVYLYEKLKEGTFPFWTERIFSGFPIYADVESGYLHPINIIATYIFGPVWSYKILHFAFYLLGSLSFYLFLRRKKIDIFGYFLANLVYFFTFFHLYHQQHFNMILTTYLLPTALLLVDLFLDSKKLRYLFLNVLVFANFFYFGSLQILCMFLCVCFLYFVVFSYRKLPLKVLLIYWGLFAALLLALILPLLTPAYELYMGSIRQGGSGVFLQGSFLPTMFVNLFYPYLFGWGGSYEGISVYQEYFKHEVYLYIGVSTFIFGTLGFLLKKKDRTDLFFRGLLVSFLFLGFVRFIPFVNSTSLPLISMFRYWGRSAVLFTFSMAFYVAYFVSNLEGKKIFTKNKLFELLGVLGFLGLCQFIYWKDWAFIQLVRYLKRQLKTFAFFDAYFFVWVALLLTSLFVLFLVLRYKSRSYTKWLLCGVIAIDIFFFGRAALRYAFKPSFYVIDKIPIESTFDNKRLVSFDNRFYANRGLYYRNWTPFGYSQFEPKVYTALINEVGLEKVKGIDRRKGISNKLLTDNLSVLGVYAIYDPTNSLYLERNFPFATEDMALIEVKEGYVKAGGFLREPGEIDTFIRNYNGWDLYVNEKISEFSKNSDTFLKFNLPSGGSIVELKYTPKALYRGFTYSVIAGVSILFVIWYMRRRGMLDTFTV